MDYSFTPKDLSAIYRRKIENWALSSAEESEKIPRGERVARGKASVRVWTLEQLPAIGKQFGWLKCAAAPISICITMPKASVLKSTIAFNLSRALAINGQKVLAIGLDKTGGVSDSLNLDQLQTLKDDAKTIGLHSALKEGASLEKLVKHTNLPTLNFIPETSQLFLIESLTEVEISERLSHLLENAKQTYDVVVFDTSSSLTALDKSAIRLADHILVPLGCDLRSYRASDFGVRQLSEALSKGGNQSKSVTYVPTLKQQTRLSLEIEANYRLSYPTQTLGHSIRVNEDSEEGANQLSVFEAEPTLPIAEDYFHVISQFWSRVIETTKSPPG